MYENLADFGEILAADGKAVQSFATKLSNKDSRWCLKGHKRSGGPLFCVDRNET